MLINFRFLLLLHRITESLFFNDFAHHSILLTPTGEDIKGKPAAGHTKGMLNGGDLQNNEFLKTQCVRLNHLRYTPFDP